jgi:hypothetical protein
MNAGTLRVWLRQAEIDSGQVSKRALWDATITQVLAGACRRRCTGR